MIKIPPGLHLRCQGEQGKEWGRDPRNVSSPRVLMPILFWRTFLTVAKLKGIRKGKEMGNKEAISRGSALMPCNGLRSAARQEGHERYFPLDQ